MRRLPRWAQEHLIAAVGWIECEIQAHSALMCCAQQSQLSSSRLVPETMCGTHGWELEFDGAHCASSSTALQICFRQQAGAGKRESIAVCAPSRKSHVC